MSRQQMGFCALCQCLNQSVTPARSTFPAPRPLPALNPSTCVPCTDIQMRADNTRDLHVSVIAWICHTSQPGGLPPRPGEPVVGEGQGAAPDPSGRSVLLGRSISPGWFPVLAAWAVAQGWMGLRRLMGQEGPTGLARRRKTSRGQSSIPSAPACAGPGSWQGWRGAGTGLGEGCLCQC